VASAFTSALGAVLLQDRQFAVHANLTDAAVQSPEAVTQ